MKFIVALWDADQQALLSAELRATLGVAGVTRLQVNLDDQHIPETVLRLQHFEERLTSVVQVWDGSAQQVLHALRPYADRLAAWQVEERQPLVPPEVPAGQRLEALAQVAFLRRPVEMRDDVWRAHWQGPHTRIAMETQATFGYIQNRVVAKLTEDTPDIDAIVEELFPAAAMSDIHAFYGSNGDQAELHSRLTRLMESVAKMGADHDLDVVPTSRYAFELAGEQD